jgi:hypothetical protein
MTNSCTLNSLPHEMRMTLFDQILDDLGEEFGTRNVEQIFAEAYRCHNGHLPDAQWLHANLQLCGDYKLPYAVTRTHLERCGNPDVEERAMLA